ncbi:MAG: transglycosylase domain-containing protein, partial [Streptosporangiaceae bacterium]
PDGPTGPYRPNGPTGPSRPDGLRPSLPPRVPGRRNRTPVKVKGSWWRHWTIRKVLGIVLGIVGLFIVLAAIAVAVAYEKTPVPTDALAATSYSQSVVYSANGTLVGRFGNTNREMLSYEQLSQSKYLVNAVLAAEDRNFFHEGGVSPMGIARAAYEDSRGNDGSLQGGSTITQEFVRQYYSGIGTQQTFSRKIKEIFVSLKIGKEKSKQWILTNYLNTIYLGDGAYGVEAASQTYFGVPVAKLNLAQAAVIAAVIQQPSTYPLPQYRAQLENRWHYVLDGMVKMGTLTQQQAAAMKFPKMGDYVPQSVGTDVWDPYVLYMVQSELKDVYHLSSPQILNGGYTIRTSINDAKMAALYQAVRDGEAQIDESSVPFNPATMHAGGVLEDPSTGAIEALYAGPGYPGSKYNGTGKVISQRYCLKIHCEENMAVVAREQVGSSFKPYILALAVKEGMNVQTSTLDGYNFQYIPPDSDPQTYPSTSPPAAGSGWSGLVTNDDTGENGPYTPQIAMAASINTAYADLWHVVAGPNGQNVVQFASELGVDTQQSGLADMSNQYGVALGQASLTVSEQATMLATIDDGGIYHDAHVITKITRASAPPTPIKITSYPVFSADSQENTEMASQVQYAMSEDTASYGTAPNAALSNGQEIIAKTGTTNKAQSAFFIGAIPSQSLAVALFSDNQGSTTKETLNGLGGLEQGGYGGTWPATIWHTYAENEFVPLGVETYTAPVFTGQTWNLVPPSLRVVPKKKKASNKNNQNNQWWNQGNGNNGDNNGNNNGGNGNGGNNNGGNGNGGNGNGGNGQSVGATRAGAVGGGISIELPATLLWVRRRRRKRGHGSGAEQPQG